MKKWYKIEFYSKLDPEVVEKLGKVTKDKDGLHIKTGDLVSVITESEGIDDFKVEDTTQR